MSGSKIESITSDFKVYTHLKVLPSETSKDQLEVAHVQYQLQYEIFLLLFYFLSLRMADKLSVLRKDRKAYLNIATKITDNFRPSGSTWSEV